MGNRLPLPSEPKHKAQLVHSQNEITLHDFRNLPTEIQLYTLSFIPLNQFSNMLLISKPINDELMTYYEIYTIFYLEFRTRALEEINSWNRNSGGFASFSPTDTYFDQSSPISTLHELPLQLDGVFQMTGFESPYKQLRFLVMNHLEEREAHKTQELAMAIRPMKSKRDNISTSIINTASSTTFHDNNP